MIQPEAFILLNIPNATLTAKGSTYRGTLALECVTVAAPQTSDSKSPTRDVYLVLRIDSFETPLDPSRTVQCTISDGFRHYSLSGGNGEDVTVDLREPSKHESHLQEDFDTFDSILAQYAEFRGPQTNPASPRGFGKQEDLRGHLVLVNEDSGEIVGELDNQIVVQEDPALNEKGREKEPVVVEIPEDDDDDARSIFVRAIPAGQGDLITKSASLISYAISGTTNLLLTAITSASSYVIKNSEPHPSASASSSASSSEPPPLPPRALVLLTSERTRKGLATVHAMSGQAVQVSGKTVALVNSMIKRAVGTKEKNRATSTSTLSPGAFSMSRSPSPLPQYSASEKPPLPPRKGDISSSPAQPPPLPSRSESGSGTGTVGTKDRLILSIGLILSTIDNSAKQILDVGGQQLNAIVEHKYGADAAHSTALLTGAAQNVGLVYIDMRGIGRKALIKRAGKEYVKGRFSKSKGKSSEELAM